MNRLQAELQRLYGPGRIAVLEVAGAGGWAELAKVWQGVLADLELPAPAIAVNGADAYQLWFSFAAPVTEEAEAFLASLRARYLRDLPADRVRWTLQPDAMPPQQFESERWSAFVSPDLATLFDEGPWLDMSPGADAQADLLARLQSMRTEDVQRALLRLQSAPVSPVPTSNAAAHADEPRSFLLRVMNDAGVDMHLRIEAAKALLAAPERPAR